MAKLLWFTLVFLLFCLKLTAQEPVKELSPRDFKKEELELFSKKKRIPEAIRKQVLTALSYYPELKNTRITFRFRKRTTPLASRPRFFSAFLPKGIRSYVITISTKTNPKLSPILFENLPYNAQIGVLGHEIAHTLYYKSRTSLQLLGIAFKLGNETFVDDFEFNTDQTVIAQGLGYQLLSWSTFVLAALKIEQWNGFDSKKETFEHKHDGIRYMNPKSIRAYMEKFQMYKDVE